MFGFSARPWVRFVGAGAKAVAAGLQGAIESGAVAAMPLRCTDSADLAGLRPSRSL